MIVSSVFAFGDSSEMADQLAGLVVQGVKTATCGWPITDPPEISVGEISVVLDGSGYARALICTIELSTQPFLQVSADFAFDEGEGDRTLDWWRTAHLRYFSRQLDAPRPFTDQEELLCERFRVIYAEEANAG